MSAAIGSKGPEARPFFTPEEDAIRVRRVLDAPLDLSGESVRIENVEFVVPARFALDTRAAALFSKSAKRLVLRNVVIRTEFERWEPAWAKGRIAPSWCGLRLDTTEGLVIDGLHVEGFPQCGLTAYRLRSAKIERVSATRCMMGLDFPWVGGACKNLLLDRVRVWDLWGPGPGVLAGFGNVASQKRPGGWSGGDGLAGYFEDAMLSNLDFSGELYAGMKLVRSKRVKIRDVRTNALMIQGTQTSRVAAQGGVEPINVDGARDGSEQIEIQRLFIDKALGSGDVTERGNGLQVSFNVKGLEVLDFTMLASGKGGHAIQLAHQCEASFQGGLISGWNGKRGTAPACALELVDRCSVNANFETANRFADQQRIRCG